MDQLKQELDYVIEEYEGVRYDIKCNERLDSLPCLDNKPKITSSEKAEILDYLNNNDDFVMDAAKGNYSNFFGVTENAFLRFVQDKVINEDGSRNMVPDAELRSIATDFVTNHLFTSNASINFIINESYKDIKRRLDLYKKEKKIKDDKIRVVYRGGNTLHFIFNRFLKQFGIYLDELNRYKKYFKRSDVDFIVFVNAEIPNFETVYNEVKVICLKTCNLIYQKLLLTYSEHIDFEKFSQSEKNKIMQELLKEFNNASILKDPESEYNKLHFVKIKYSDVTYAEIDDKEILKRPMVMFKNKYNNQKLMIKSTRPYLYADKYSGNINYVTDLSYFLDRELVPYPHTNIDIPDNLYLKRLKEDAKTNKNHCYGLPLNFEPLSEEERKNICERINKSVFSGFSWSGLESEIMENKDIWNVSQKEINNMNKYVIVLFLNSIRYKIETKQVFVEKYNLEITVKECIPVYEWNKKNIIDEDEGQKTVPITNNESFLTYLRHVAERYNELFSIENEVKIIKSSDYNIILKHLEAKSPMYLSFSNHIKLKNSQGTEREFALARIKADITLIYETDKYTNGEPRIGAINVPGEVIDISITKDTDVMFGDIKQEIMEYSINDGKETIVSYSVNGYIVDIIRVFFLEMSRPWFVPKYEKYLKRLIILITISILKNTKKNDIVKKIIDPLKKIKTDFNGQSINILSQKEHDDYEKTLKVIMEDIKKIESPYFIKFITNALELHKHLSDKDFESVGGGDNLYKSFLENISESMTELINILSALDKIGKDTEPLIGTQIDSLDF